MIATHRAQEGGIKPLLVRLGLGALVRPWLGGRGAVLAFHRVREPDATMAFGTNGQNCVPPARLRALLAALAADDVDVVTLDEAAARLRAPSPRRFVCLTFDDGYRDNLEALLPILEAFSMPATIYIAPGLLDGSAKLWWYALDHALASADMLRLPADLGGGIHARAPDQKRAAFATVTRLMLLSPPHDAARIADALAASHGADYAALARAHMLDWEGVRRLAASPLIEIGAHTTSHPSLARLDDAAAQAEMAGSRDRLAQETGRAVRHFAYPFGTADTVGVRELRLAAALGFATAVSTTPGNLFPRHAQDGQCWPRHGIGPGDGPAALHLKLAGVARPRRKECPAS
jgi:peptidoglycan/xylan/chitin deacetylase (PgdA/CDA1 family)